MNIIITGGKGQIGSEFSSEPRINIHRLSRAELDITDPRSIEAAFDRYNPNHLINCAAYTAVDKAEQETQAAFTINRDGAACLAHACADRNIPLIHLSTDYVFDGRKPVAVNERDQVNPLNQYGKSKWAGEEAIRKIAPRHIILRVSGVFGYTGTNFVKTILRIAQEREVLQVVTDQITCITPANHIAQICMGIAQMITEADFVQWGTYHYRGTEITSWHELAHEIISLAQHKIPLKVQFIKSITTAQFNATAIRPLYSVLDCTKLFDVFGIGTHSSKQALEELVCQLAEDKSK